MWDFILRTFQHLSAHVNPQHPFSSQDPLSSSMLNDFVGRTSLAKDRILDTTAKLTALYASVGYFDDVGVEFGPEICASAETLEVPPGCAGCRMSERLDGKDLFICARCKADKYCSAEYQKKCWKIHKKTCVAV
jgi:hypothetical protein